MGCGVWGVGMRESTSSRFRGLSASTRPRRHRAEFWLTYVSRSRNALCMSPSPTPPTPIGGVSSHEGPPVDPPQSARARQRAETRERLFEVALREFRDVGFAAAQIDRIAKSAGVARGTFYFHFPTKDDVLLELAQRVNQRMARRVAVLGDSRPTLRELLNRVNDAISDEIGRVGEAGLLAEMLSLYVRRPYDLADAAHSAPSLAEELTRHLRVVAGRGELRGMMPEEQISMVLMSSLFGIYARFSPGPELRGACSALVDLFVKGLQADPE